MHPESNADFFDFCRACRQSFGIITYYIVFSQYPQANSFDAFRFLRNGDFLSLSFPVCSLGPCVGPFQPFSTKNIEIFFSGG